MSKFEYNIETVEDLKFAKQQIKKDLKVQENSFKNNPLVKISSSLYGGTASKGKPFVSNFSKGKRRAGSNMIKSLLLANKLTRKYLIAYTIAKEMIPFTINKLNGLFKQ